MLLCILLGTNGVWNNQNKKKKTARFPFTPIGKYGLLTSYFGEKHLTPRPSISAIINNPPPPPTTSSSSSDDDTKNDLVYPFYLPLKQSSKEINVAVRRFPKCQHPDWCDQWFGLKETLEMQRWIYESQHPVDCDKARLLIVIGQWKFGVGSIVDIRSRAFALGMLLFFMSSFLFNIYFFTSLIGQSRAVTRRGRFLAPATVRAQNVWVLDQTHHALQGTSGLARPKSAPVEARRARSHHVFANAGTCVLLQSNEHSH